MLKKICLCLCLLCFLCPMSVQAEKLDLAPNAAASILMEEKTNQILYADHEKEKLYPASTTKIMTMILMFETIESGRLKWNDILTCSEHAASMGGSQIYLEPNEKMSVFDLFKAISIASIESGRLKWNDILTCSEHAASMGGSQIYLEPNEKMSVFDLFKAISIASANDACVMVGEYIAGSHEGFVKMMNEKAKELKLINTHFMNATGLHDENHYTCALDLAIMASYLIDIGQDKLFETTSLYDSYIREDSPQKFWLVNTNKLLKSYEGADGLKTGYTKEAGYCIVSTAKRNGLRLIAVVLKEKEPKVRNQEVSTLLDYGFSLYENVILYKKGEVVDKVKIDNAKEKEVEIICQKDIVYVKDKSQDEKITHQINYVQLVPPIKKGEIVGHFLLMKDNVNIASYELTVTKDIETLTFIEKMYSYLKCMI